MIVCIKDNIYHLLISLLPTLLYDNCSSLKNHNNVRLHHSRPNESPISALSLQIGNEKPSRSAMRSTSQTHKKDKHGKRMDSSIGSPILHWVASFASRNSRSLLIEFATFSSSACSLARLLHALLLRYRRTTEGQTRVQYDPKSVGPPSTVQSVHRGARSPGPQLCQGH